MSVSIFKEDNSKEHWLLSLTPLFLFFLKEPQYITAGSTVACHFWRKCTSKKVWYEWCMSRPAPIPLHNPGGRSYVIGLWSSRRELYSVFLFVFNFQCSKRLSVQWAVSLDEYFFDFYGRGVWSSVLLWLNFYQMLGNCKFWHPALHVDTVFITSILKSLVILPMWLVLGSAIYSQITLLHYCIFFLGQWEWHRKTKQPIRFQGFF